MVHLRCITLAIISMGLVDSLEKIELGAPAEVDRSRQRLQGLNVNRMCHLTPECAHGVLEPLETVMRPAFFESCRARDRYCGSPGGFSDWVRVSGDTSSRPLPHSRDSAIGTARDVLYRNGTWETPWTALRHLADPSTCLAGVAGTSHIVTADEEGNSGEAQRTRRLHRGHKRSYFGSTSARLSGVNQASQQQGSRSSHNSKACSLSLDVPLVEMRDVFLGGQFVPFTRDGRSFVPLATAQERGGLAQSCSTNHSGSTSSTSTGSSSSHATRSCCFPIESWATDERGALAREREALLWAQPQHLAKAPVLVLDRAIVAHGGGWGDYQGGSGDNYFHTIQALASVAFLLPRLEQDQGLVLLMRTCKEPWFKLKQTFAPWKVEQGTSTHGDGGGGVGSGGASSRSSAGSLSSSSSSANGGLSLTRGFTCGVEAYTKSLLEALGIPLRQVVHYPYDEHDPTFSSLAYRSDPKVFTAVSPVVQLRRALMQPPHVQHDAQLSELRTLLARSPAYSHLPFNRSAIVVVSRNGLVPSGRCKRCVPNQAELVAKLREHFAPQKMEKGHAVVEVHGDEPYPSQVAAFRQAAVVLAPHGAALTSMLHMPPGAAVFELLHSRNKNRQWFMVMAAKLGLRYWAVPSHEPPLNEQLEARKLMTESRHLKSSYSSSSSSDDDSSSISSISSSSSERRKSRRRRRRRSSSDTDNDDDATPGKVEIAKDNHMANDEDVLMRRSKMKAKKSRKIKTTARRDVPISGGASFHTGLVTVNSAYEGIDLVALIEALDDALNFS